MTTSVGRLKEEITIQEPNYDQSGSGEKTVTWSDFVTTRAEVTEDPQSAREFAEGTEYTQIDTEFRIRWRANHGINESMRVLFDDEQYRIHSVARDDGLRRWIFLDCVKEDVEVAR